MANEKRLDLIDRQEVVDAISKIGVVSVGTVIGCLSDAKRVDAVEVVWCKDCKRCTNTKEPNVVYCKTLNRFRGAFDFCSYGERREGE